MAVLEGALLLGLAPKDFVVAVGVERRVNVDEVHALIGQLAQLFQVIAAIDDAGIPSAEGRPAGWFAAGVSGAASVEFFDFACLTMERE